MPDDDDTTARASADLSLRLALFFLLVSIGAHWNCIGHGKIPFAMTWYSFVFPQTGLTVSPCRLSR